jgi:hypothetical protein
VLGDGAADPSDDRGQLDNGAHDRVPCALMSPLVLLLSVLLVSKGNCDSISFVEVGRIVMDRVVESVSKLDSVEGDDPCSSWASGPGEFTGSHSIKVAHNR